MMFTFNRNVIRMFPASKFVFKFVIKSKVLTGLRKTDIKLKLKKILLGVVTYSKINETCHTKVFFRKKI